MKELKANNAGNIDRILRIAVGLALVVWALMPGPIWAWIGVIPLVTGIMGFCPLYTIFGINTCKASK